MQAQSMLFDEQGRCYQLTVGYSCDRQTGNTGGLGAVFGLMHGIGKTLPFPEARPWRPSPPYRLGLRLSKVAERFGFGPRKVWPRSKINKNNEPVRRAQS